MSKLLSRLKSNWSACFSALMKPKATRSSRIVSCRTKTKLAVERCEPRLALDASQVPEGQPEGFLELNQPTAESALSSGYGVSLSEAGFYVNPGVISYQVLIQSDSINEARATPPSHVSPTLTGSDYHYGFRVMARSAGAQADLSFDEAIPLDTASQYDSLLYRIDSINDSEAFSDLANSVRAKITSTNNHTTAFRLGLTHEFASEPSPIITNDVVSNASVQDVLTSLSSFEPTEVSSVGEKQPKASNEGSSLTTSLSKHHHTDPAVLHVSSLQTISFESAKPVFHADQAFTVLASNDGAQIAMPQSKMARGEPSSTGFLDVQATIAGIDSAQKMLFEPVVFDNENGSSLFEENVHQDNTNSMPVMARATLFEVAEHRVPPLPREVLHGYDGDVKTAGGEKVVASPTLLHDMLVASGDSDDWASSDLSLNVRLFLVAAFATTTFELDKRYRSNDFSTNNANDTNAKQKCLLR